MSCPMWYLVGFKGCGKSVVGKRLAELMPAGFVDLDKEIEQEYENTTGERLSFRQIYRKLGKEGFRAMEQTALEAQTGGQRTVVSVGGGTLEFAENGQHMRRTGTVVYIKVAPEELYRRIVADDVPAFFASDDPRQEFSILYAKRVVVYEAMADLTVDTMGLGIEESARKIYEVLTGRKE